MSDDSKVDDLVSGIDNLGLNDKRNQDDSSFSHELDEEIKRVAGWIRESQNIMILSGAGVSCSAGIPDFRTPGTGLYDNLLKYNLPYPEAVFDVDFYRRKPQPFLSLAKELWPGLRHSPTATHSFAATLANKKQLLRNYTQNIDGLEHLATIPEEKIVECHGHFRSASCVKCGTPMDGDKCKSIILHTDEVPKCVKPKCNGFVKPDVVFFGEGLPNRFHSLLSSDVKNVDLLMVMGTSLQVAPVRNIPDYVKCRKVLINREEVGNFFGDDDAVLLGDCDEIVMRLAQEIGWDGEIRALNKKTRVKVESRIEEEPKA
jgi:NAD-dependent SIR2 family protein deacetylase